MKKILMLTAAGFMIQATPVLAGHHEGGDHKDKGAKMEEMFSETDANGDGQISKDEYLAHVQKKASEKFAKKDANGDGNLTMDESKAYYAEKKESRKEKMKERMEHRKEMREERKMEAESAE